MIERLSRLDLPRRPIAVIGAACRLPGGVTTLDELWTLLAGGVDAISAMPSTRLELVPEASRGALQGGFIDAACGLDGIAGFDAPYFNTSPREAAAMDPQQRLLLQVTAEALDESGLTSSSLDGSATGVFLGVTANEVFLTLEFVRTALTDPRAAHGLPPFDHPTLRSTVAPPRAFTSASVDRLRRIACSSTTKQGEGTRLRSK